MTKTTGDGKPGCPFAAAHHLLKWGQSNAQSSCSPALPWLCRVRGGPILYHPVLADVERRRRLAGVRPYA